MKDHEIDLRKGEELFKSGLIHEAEEIFEKIVISDPLNHEALNDLGTVLYHKGDYKSAEIHFMKALALDEKNPDVLINLADLYFNTKEWDRAAYFLERYIDQNPLDKVELNRLAVAHIESGSSYKAVSVLKKSLEIDKTQEEIQTKLAAITREVNSRTAKAKPLVAIGLPVYNGEKYIAQAIESILSQDFCDFELIISDNHSTDKTREICLSYQRKDGRVNYHRFDQNMGMLINFHSVLGRATSEFFMFATYDDLREGSYIGKCMKPLLDDPCAALVYSRSKVLDADSNFLGIAQDLLHADQESPRERFRQVIWELGMCNAFLGIFRLSILKKLKSWNTSLFSDTVLLAETSLLGKIIQIEEPLFIRRLTRNYNYRSHEERNAQLISDIDPGLFKEGISLPHCRLAYNHLDIVNLWVADVADKNSLINEVKTCFRTRFGQKMTYEIDRAIALINRGCYYHEWNNPIVEISDSFPELKSFHISALLKGLEEARFFYPERQDLTEAIGKCRAELRS